MHQVFSLLDCSLARANAVVFAFISDRAQFESILHPGWCLRCFSFLCFFSLSFPFKQAQNLNPSAHLQSPSPGPAARLQFFFSLFLCRRAPESSPVFPARWNSLLSACLPRCSLRLSCPPWRGPRLDFPPSFIR